jgi:DNA helicase HerA-like ATPase
MAQESTTLVGRITEVRENGLTAELTVDHSNGFPFVTLGKEELLVGQVGSYLRIEQKDIKIIGLVSHSYEEGGGSKQGMISLIPVGELTKDGHFSRGIGRYPTPGAEVHVMGSADIGVMFERFRAMGFDLGHMPSYPAMRVYLDPSAMFGRHLAILGQSGSGKSWGVTTLIQRAVSIMPKAHVIVLDLHGEYVWTERDGTKRAAFTKNTVQAIDARDLEIPYWLLTYGELVDLLVDRTDENATVQMAFLREVLYTLRKKANKDISADKISIDSPLYFPLAELYHHFKRANEQTSDFGKVKGPLFGQFDEFLIKLQSRLNDVRYDFLFKPKRRNSSDTLADLLREFVGLKEPKYQVTVIDFSSVPFDVRPTVSAQIGRLAFEFNYWNPQSRQFPLLLVCEEAHAYIPRAGGSGFEGTRKSMERIAKEGRKYGVGLAVVSQRPHELSETVLSQCSSYLCFRVTNPDDQAYIRDLVPDSEGDLVDILSSLGRGEAVALGEASPVLTRFQMRRPNPPPNSDDVDFYTQWREGPEDLNVDAIVDRWQRQGRD